MASWGTVVAFVGEICLSQGSQSIALKRGFATLSQTNKCVTWDIHWDESKSHTIIRVVDWVRIHISFHLAKNSECRRVRESIS